MRTVFLMVGLLSVMPSAIAFGDFPLASCKSHGGTIVEKSGTNTANALIRGIVTKADLQEYCDRDPGGITILNAGKLTISQCVTQLQQETRKVEISSTANCNTGVLNFLYDKGAAVRVKFPLAPNSDTSCASGMPPLIAQFKIMCPNASAQWGIQ